MINAGISIVRVTSLAFGATLVVWTYALAQSRNDDGSFQNFFRMFVGWMLLAAVIEVMYI